MSRSTGMVRFLSTALIATALLLATASTAFAVTGDPTLGLAALQAKLDASPGGTVTGYLKTVVKGSKIETIPVEVLALTGDTAADSLIMFEASGELIDRYGGIVSGMSGSPLYVQDGGVDKVIGALSYGDIFTLNGSGLATPIESMTRLTTDYAPRVDMLSSPVLMSGRLIDRVIISSDPNVLKNVSPRSAFVARQFAPVFIGGMPPASNAYKKLAKSLEDRGLSVMALETPLSASASTFTTDLVPGAALAVLGTRGDIWIGSLGTTTWADGDTVLAFGHPAFYTGPTSLYMCNAWISGVWPSSYMPYKLGYPTVVRGTITQDRGAGIMGELGAPPAEAPITARVTSGSRVATSAAWVSSQLQDTEQIGYLAGSVAYSAGEKIFDIIALPGSANTTATIRLSVGGTEYTVTMVNVMDSSYDILSGIGADADDAVSSVLSVIYDGVEQPHILSTDVQAQVTTSRRYSRIVGVDLDEPLHEGDNTVLVSTLTYGLAATQTIETTLTIPEGAPLSGTLVAQGAVSSSSADDGLSILVASPGSPPAPRETVADIVADLNSRAPDNSFTLKLVPDSFSDVSADESEPVSVTQITPWVMDGTASAAITQVTADVSPYSVSYGGTAVVSGEVYGPSKSVMVNIYGLPEGSHTPGLLSQERASYLDGTLSYEATLDGLTTNMAIFVTVDGGPDYTPATAETYVEVRARIVLTSSGYKVRFGRHVTLTARVSPRSARGRVTFQYWEGAHKHWRTIGTRYLHAAGSYAHAQIDWMPRWGDRKVRAIYNGSLYNAGVTSAMITTHTR